MSTDMHQSIPLTALEVAREATSPTQLVALAIANGTPAETLGRLLDVQERWLAIQAKKEFDAAMANFKSECPSVIAKDSTVDFTSQKGRTHYKYADRADITEIATPFLSKHGLSATFETDTETPNIVKVTCEIAHKGGHSKKTALKGPVDASGNKNALQAIGSAVEYLSRYTFNAALGLATKGQDDDGRAAGQPIDQGYRTAAKEPNGNGGNQQQDAAPKSESPEADFDNTWNLWKAGVMNKIAAIRNAPDPKIGYAALTELKTRLKEYRIPEKRKDIIAEVNQAIADADNALAIDGGDFRGSEQLQLLETLLKMATAPAAVDKIAEQWDGFPDLDDATKAKGVEAINMRRVALGGTA